MLIIWSKHTIDISIDIGKASFGEISSILFCKIDGEPFVTGLHFVISSTD